MFYLSCINIQYSWVGFLLINCMRNGGMHLFLIQQSNCPSSLQLWRIIRSCSFTENCHNLDNKRYDHLPTDQAVFILKDKHKLIAQQ